MGYRMYRVFIMNIYETMSRTQVSMTYKSCGSQHKDRQGEPVSLSRLNGQ